MPRRSTLVEFRRAEDEQAYRECLEKGVGFVANCWAKSMYGGYILHQAGCPSLKGDGRNPRGPVGKPISDRVQKLWAATAEELDEHAGYPIPRCTKGCI